METWGIARDMAKLNEENLSKLSRKGMYTILRERSSKSRNKTYRFNKATPEIILAIRKKMEVENLAMRKRNRIIWVISIFMVSLFVALLSLLRI